MKILVLSSGGIDSTTCLALAVQRVGAENVVALSVQYGQKHDRELKAAQAVADHYHVEALTIDISCLFTYSDCALLKHSQQALPHGDYAHQLHDTHGAPVATYVPFRNGLLLSAAAGIALSKGCSVLLYGAHSDDAAGNAYPDCSDAFNTAMNAAIYEGSGHALTVEAPFLHANKVEVVRQGLALSVPYHLTWSCYQGGETPCGTCGTCIDRRAAFTQNHTADPIGTDKE